MGPAMSSIIAGLLLLVAANVLIILFFKGATR